MTDVLFYITTFLLQTVTVLFIARFLLQACRADFYNPISQGIVKVTDPVLKPMRMVLPGYRNLDFASFLAAVLAQIDVLASLNYSQGSTGMAPGNGWGTCANPNTSCHGTPEARKALQAFENAGSLATKTSRMDDTHQAKPDTAADLPDEPKATTPTD